MSKEDDDKTLPDDCFWVQHGKCFLYQMDEEWVFDFLSRIPKARKDLLTCAQENICPFTDADFVAFAQKGITTIDAREESDRFQSLMSKFVDRHRRIQGGQVFRKADDDSNDDDE